MKTNPFDVMSFRIGIAAKKPLVCVRTVLNKQPYKGKDNIDLNSALLHSMFVKLLNYVILLYSIAEIKSPFTESLFLFAHLDHTSKTKNPKTSIMCVFIHITSCCLRVCLCAVRQRHRGEHVRRLQLGH